MTEVRPDDKTITIRLNMTEKQLVLLLQTVNQRALFIKRNPLPEDGDIYERLSAISDILRDTANIYF